MHRDYSLGLYVGYNSKPLSLFCIYGPCRVALHLVCMLVIIPRICSCLVSIDLAQWPYTWSVHCVWYSGSAFVLYLWTLHSYPSLGLYDVYNSQYLLLSCWCGPCTVTIHLVCILSTILKICSCFVWTLHNGPSLILYAVYNSNYLLVFYMYGPAQIIFTCSGCCV